MAYSPQPNLMTGPPMQDQSARPPYLPSQAGMVNGDGHSYQTHSLRPPGGQFPTYAEQRQQQQTPMKPMSPQQFPHSNTPYYQQPPHSTSGNAQQILNQPMGNLQISSNQQKLSQQIPPPGMPNVKPEQPAIQPQQGPMDKLHYGVNSVPGAGPNQQLPTSQFTPGIATGPPTGVRPDQPQHFPGPMSHPPRTINGPNLNLSGPSVPSQHSVMPPHSPGQSLPLSQTQSFSMANPGAPQRARAPGHRNYPPRPGASPMNLAGPMPPMGPANGPSSTAQMPGYGPGPSRPSPGGMPMSSPMPQQSRRIDPDQIPSPIQVMKDDQDNFKDTSFNTSVRGRVPPLITTKCVIRDDGNCSPKFMRSTVYNVPTNQDVLKASGVPFAVSVSPFAEIPGEESSLQLVDHGANGPVRCNRCKAYMNPFMQFIDGGRRFLCNICNYSSEVPQEYFSHLDHQGLRVDIYQRPELCLGSYEYVATADYCKNQKLPEPPAYIFMIEASYQSIQCGMLRMLVREIPALLERLPKMHGQNESLVKVGFVTYNSSLHFYNVKSNLAQPQMMIVSDINDVFVPLLDGFLVNAKEAKTVIESLMEQIPDMFADTRETEIVLAPVVQAGLDALKSAGICGKLLLFHTSLPICEAPGKLKNREDRKLLATDKEKTILCPQTNFYEKLAKSCVETGVAVDLFLFPNAFIDVATIGALTSCTGGQLYRYSFFKETTHGEQFRQDLIRNIERNVGLDTIMRLRTSTGLRPCEFYGNFHMNNTTDVELALVSSQTSMVIEIKHDDKLQEDSVAYLQCALLYTNICGQRRLRIHNLALSTCNQLTDLFRCCEMDTFTNYMAKHAIKQVCNSVPKTIRENIVNQAASILACYRQHCAAPSSAGQLILPECMKLLPLYSNSVLKSDALTGGSEMSSDDRSWLMQTVLGMDIASTVSYFYPRLIPLHELNTSETTSLPSQIRCSEERLKENGVYLLENGIVLFMWIGLHVDRDWLQQVFGVATIGHVDIEMTSLPELDSALSRRVRGIIAQIQRERPRYMKLTIVRQRDKMEPWFRHYLVEDKGLTTTSHSYVDFLCIMHKEVRSLLN